MSKRELARALFGPEIGCYDGSCIYGAPGGMQTNGGCNCEKGERHELRMHLRRLSRMVTAALNGGGE